MLQACAAVGTGHTETAGQIWAPSVTPDLVVWILLLLKEGAVVLYSTRTCHMRLCFVFCSGKSNPYCEISMGSQSYTTRTLPDTLNPKWNFNCQFFIKDLYQDVLCLTMFDRDQFSPDGTV